MNFRKAKREEMIPEHNYSNRLNPALMSDLGKRKLNQSISSMR